MQADSWQNPVPTGIKAAESEQIRLDTEKFLEAGGEIFYADPGYSEFISRFFERDPEIRRRNYNNRV